ncbi:hypothetical protein HXX01_01310 [Candidatus Nomurabacteria bacterium]|nr:hypothetical protein [Candidatus Nomurabacteria bacterium]
MKTKVKDPTNDVISASELLQGVFTVLTKNLNGTKLRFKKRLESEIADDSDQHRTKKGYMSYKEFTIFESNGKRWALSFGTKSGDYPGNNFQSDLIAFPLASKEVPAQTRKEIATVVPTQSPFKNSFIVVMYDGNLAFRKPLGQLISDNMAKFGAEEAKYNENFNMDGTPCVVSEASYKKEVVEFFADKLQTLFV